MSSSNYRRNKAAIDQFRKELTAMLDDIGQIDVSVLNKAVNAGTQYAKKHSPVITGFFIKSWMSTPTVRAKDGCAEKILMNHAEYASFVNYGHRTVDKDGKTTGYVKSKAGDHLLEKTVSFIDRQLGIEFEKAVKEVRQKHDK